jgi:hypothetical protein
MLSARQTEARLLVLTCFMVIARQTEALLLTCFMVIARQTEALLLTCFMVNARQTEALLLTCFMVKERKTKASIPRSSVVSIKQTRGQHPEIPMASFEAGFLTFSIVNVRQTESSIVRDLSLYILKSSKTSLMLPPVFIGEYKADRGQHRHILHSEKKQRKTSLLQLKARH